MTVKKSSTNKIDQKLAKVSKKVDIKVDETVNEASRRVQMLKSFGLSDHESRVYIYLLERGSAVGGSKIALGTELHRQYVYLALPKLIELNLVEEVAVGKLSKYKARAPQEIEKIAKRRAIEAEDIVRELQKFSKVGHEQDFEIYVGAEAIQKYEYEWVMSVKEKENQYIIGGNTVGFAEMMGDTLNEYLVNETRKYVTTYYLGGINEKDFYVPYISNRIDLKMRFLKQFPQNMVSHMVIRRGSVLFYSFLKPELLYVIRSQIVAKNYEDFFMMLWDMAGGEEMSTEKSTL